MIQADANAAEAPATAEPLLKLRGVKAYYGRIIALKGIDLDIAEGEIAALIGANGAGKSTLMMTICGDGVSPAAKAAARGSPPGKAAATFNAELIRFAGSGSRQRKITRSTAGSRSFTTVDGLLGADSLRTRTNSGKDSTLNARLPVKIS